MNEQINASTNTITIKDALLLAQQKLNGISVPVQYLEAIGQPIKESCDMLSAVLRVIDQAEKDARQQEDEEAKKLEEI